MTIREKMEQKLQENMLWPAEAVSVMDAVQDEPSAEAMQGRWNDSADGYPPQLLAVAWLTVQHTAAKWLAANAPMHFARVMFPTT